MNKKGFTLIELLAVIVILAIIALIATPIVLNIIDDAKKESELRSAEFYLKRLELSIAQAILDEENITDGIYNIMSDGNVCLEQGVDSNCPKDKTLVVEVKGKVAEKGTVVIENGKIVEKLSTDESKKTKFEINNQKVEMVNGKLKYSEEPTLASLCEYQNNEAAEKTVGAKYKCNFGDGERYFYILELGSNPVNNSTLKSDEVALILNENYDEETLPWCDQDGPYPFDSKCAADGLTSKLEEIREKWESKLSDNQIVLPTVEQIATADGKVYTDYPNLEKTWLYQWEGNDSFNNGDGPSYGYWTSTLGEAGWKNYALGVGHDSGIYIDIAIYDYDTFGVRPVVTLKK